MSSTYDATANPTTQASAQTALDELMAWVGVDGLVAALRTPGLLAEIDQHAAAVRDAIVAAGRPVDALSLSRYARSIAAAADRMGRPLPEQSLDGTDTDWSNAGWHLLRLVAVCAIADELGCL
jgi:hypothetical protein